MDRNLNWFRPKTENGTLQSGNHNKKMPVLIQTNKIFSLDKFKRFLVLGVQILINSNYFPFRLYNSL